MRKRVAPFVVWLLTTSIGYTKQESKMSKKAKSEKQLLYEKRAKEINSFGQPPDTSKKFIKITHYMLQHENFKNLIYQKNKWDHIIK